MKVGTKLFLMATGTALIILVMGITSLVSLTELVESNRLVSHSKDVLRELHILMFNISDCVATQRGYIISGKEAFLDAYQEGLVNTNESANEIEKLVADNPAQLERIKVMKVTIKERLQSLETTVALYKAKGSEAAFDRIRTGNSLQFRITLAKEIEAIRQHEQELLEQRVKEATSDAFAAQLTVFIGMLLALGYLAVSNFLFGSSILTCVKQLITASENITYGRFDLSAQTNSNDEFADLAAAFNSLGHQLLLSSKQLKRITQESEEQKQQLARFQSHAEELQAKLEAVSRLSDAETTSLESYKGRLTELDQWLAKLSETALTFQELERTNHDYIQRITFFNEDASRNISSLQAELEVRQDVDHSTLGRDFASRIIGLTDLSQSIEELIDGIELVTLAAEMEAARADIPNKALTVFISTLKEKTREAKSTREHVQKYLTELKAATSEVLERYKDVTTSLSGSRKSAERAGQELDKQSELCQELRIMFADSLVQKYVAFITGRRTFTNELKDDVEQRGLLAKQLSEILSSSTLFKG